jgi:cellobiose-specific phosphotransferase system component IIA
MSGQARISSIDALEAFRADLIQYVEKARAALEDAEGEVRRTRTWLDEDRAAYWAAQCKQWTKRCEQAEAEYYNARLSGPQESHAFQKMALLKAQRQLEQAEEKLRVVHHWRQTFENRATPMLRQLDPMFYMVGRDLPKAIHSLGEAIQSLQAYAEKSSIRAAASNAPLLEPGPTETP